MAPKQKQDAVEGKNNLLYLRNSNPVESRWDRYNLAGEVLAGDVSFDHVVQMVKIPPGTIFWTKSMEARADIKTAVAYIAGKSRDAVRETSPLAYMAA